MFEINASAPAQEANKPQRTGVYMPHATMAISPFVGLDLYSDNSTPCQGTGYPDGAINCMINGSVNLGTVTTFLDKYKAGQIFDGLFDYDTRRYTAAGEKRFTFAPFFNKYNRFKSVVGYASMNEPKTLMTTDAGSYLRPTQIGGILREINATTMIWLYARTSGFLSYMIGTIDSNGTITWGSPADISAAGSLNNDYMFDCAVTGTNQLAFIFKTSSTRVDVAAATLSGTVLTVGTLVQVNGTAATALVSCGIVKIADGKFAAGYNMTTNGVFVRVGTISGTTITLGTESASLGGAAATGFTGIAANGTDSFITVLSTASTAVTAYAHTVSGTTIITGSGASLFSGKTNIGAKSEGNTYQQIRRIATNKFLVCCHATLTGSFMNIIVLTISGTTVTAGTPLSYGISNTAGVLYMHEITADASYALYRATYSGLVVEIITVSGTTVSVSKQLQRSIISSTILSTNFADHGQSSPTAYGTLLSYIAGFNKIGDFIVWISSPSATSVLYTVGKANSTFEFYNDGTLIGSAVDFAVPFMRHVFSIDSAVYNAKAYLKVKNTSADARSLLIETVVMEVD